MRKKTSPKTILTIDPGSKLGYAVGTPKAVKEYGELKVAPPEKGTDEQRLLEMVFYIDKLFKDHSPGLLIIEDTVKGSHGLPNWKSKQWLIFTCLYPLLRATELGVDTMRIHPMTLKKHMGIKAVKVAGKPAKKQMVDAVNAQLGYDLPASRHNEADALALWIWGRDQQWGKAA